MVKLDTFSQALYIVDHLLRKRICSYSLTFAHGSVIYFFAFIYIQTTEITSTTKCTPNRYHVCFL